MKTVLVLAAAALVPGFASAAPLRITALDGTFETSSRLSAFTDHRDAPAEVIIDTIGDSSGGSLRFRPKPNVTYHWKVWNSNIPPAATTLNLAPNVGYQVCARVRRDAAFTGKFRLGMRWYQDPAGTQPHAVVVTDTQHTLQLPPDTWKRRCVHGTLPAGKTANRLALEFGLSSDGISDAGHLWVDNVELWTYDAANGLPPFAETEILVNSSVALVPGFTTPFSYYPFGKWPFDEPTSPTTHDVFVELPPGVSLVSRYLSYEVYQIPTANHAGYSRHRLHFDREQDVDQLRLSTINPVGWSQPIYMSLAWGSQPATVPELEIPVSVIGIPKAKQLVRLRDGTAFGSQVHQFRQRLLGAPDPTTGLRIPGSESTWYLPLLASAGARSVSIVEGIGNIVPLVPPFDGLGHPISSSTNKANWNVPNWSVARAEAGSKGMDVHLVWVPFHPRRTSDAAFGYRCPNTSKNGVTHQEEMADLTSSAATGIRHFAFDFEENMAPPTTACRDLVTSFEKTTGFMWSEATTGLADKKDQKWSEYMRAQIGTYWHNLYDALASGLRASKIPGRPLITSYRTHPGFDHYFIDFDSLYPSVFSASSPVPYPGPNFDGSDTAAMIRLDLSGVLALTGPNLFSLSDDPSFELAAPPAGPGTGLRWDDTATSPDRTENSYAWDGARALRVSIADKSNYYYRDIKVAPAEDYIFAVSAKREGPRQACLQVGWYSSSNVLLGETHAECGPYMVGPWQRLAIHARAPSAASLARLKMSALGGTDPGSVWFDKAMVVRPNLLKTPDSASRSLTTPQPVGTIGPLAALPGSNIGYAFTASPQSGISWTLPVPAYSAAGVEFQFSVKLSSTVGQEVRIEWLSKGVVVASASTPSGKKASGEVTVTSADPGGASSVRVSVRTVSVGGSMTVREPDFRVDGPYVAPWVTPGYATGAEWLAWPNSPERYLSQILQSYVGGAQQLMGWQALFYDASILAAVATSNKMMAGNNEVIVADGRPVPEGLITTSAGATAVAMEYNDIGLVAVTKRSAATSATVSIAASVTVDEVLPTGALKPVKTDTATPLKGGSLLTVYAVEFKSKDPLTRLYRTTPTRPFAPVGPAKPALLNKAVLLPK